MFNTFKNWLSRSVSLILRKSCLRGRALWFISWLLSITERIDNAIEGQVPPEVSKKEARPKGNKNGGTSKISKNKNAKANQKSYEEPKFNTNLSIPVEDIIEETIAEDLRADSSQSLTSRKKGKTKTQPKSKSEDEDSIGESFFKTKSVKVIKSEKIPKEKSANKVFQDDILESDDVGFSFLPVKEKGKSKKAFEKKENLNNVIEGSKKTKEDPLKPAIIDHYKKKDKKPATVTKKFVTNLEKSESFVVVNRLEEKLQNQFKESKKVSSTISYANIVTNRLPEKGTEGETSAEPVIDKKNLGIGDVYFKEDLSRSNSSSIEVLNVDQNDIPESESKADFAQFDFIEENISKLVHLDSGFEPFDSLDSSSICVISNEGPETNKKEANSEQFSSGEYNTFVNVSEKSLVQAENEREFTNNFILVEKESEEAFTRIEDSFSTERGERNTSFEEISSIVKKNLSDVLAELKKASEAFQTNLYPVSTTTDKFSENFVFPTEHEIVFEERDKLPEVEKNTEDLLENSSEDQLQKEDKNNFDSLPEKNSSIGTNILQYSELNLTLEEPIEETKETERSRQTFKEQFQEEENRKLNIPLITKENFLENIDYSEQETLEEKVEREVEENRILSAEEPIRTVEGKNNLSIEEQLWENTEVCTLPEETAEENGLIKVNREVPEEETLEEKVFTENNNTVEENSLHIKENRLENLAIYSEQEIEEEVEPLEVESTLVQEGLSLSDEAVLQQLEEAILAEKLQEFEDYSSDIIKKSFASESELVNLKPYSVNKENINLIDKFEDQKVSDLIASEKNEDSSFTSQSSAKDLKEESSNLIEEELCVEKFSYITVEPEEIESSKDFKEKYSALTNTETSESIMSSKQQVRVLTLNNQEHQESTLYRIEKNWVIQFRLGPSLFGRKVFLYSNYPVENNGALAEFNREKYQLLIWALDEGCKNADDTAAYTQITVKLAGSFHYYFTYESGVNSERQGSGYFLVDPVLKYGQNENLSLDCIQCQTVLSKGLGSFSTWEKKLLVAKESGYNMVHFTPIQELGVSNSCYSLSEQLKINPAFKKENGQMPTFDEIEQFTAKMRTEWKVTSICDIVLNHTANESEWIKTHPEVTYNCSDCPYMRPAYLLDAALHQFSIQVKNGDYEDKGIPIEVNNEEHLKAISYHFRTNVLEPLKLHELFICNTHKIVADFLNRARATPPIESDIRESSETLQLVQDPEYRRLEGKIDMELAIKLYNVYWNDTFDEDSRLKRCAAKLKAALDLLNNTVIEQVNDHLNFAIDNVVAGIRYFRVQEDGPKVKEITVKNPLVYRYFTDYGSPKSLKEHEDIMYSTNGRFLMAHNGWVMNSDPLRNFAAHGSKVYIRRELIAWGDSVKLRFGDKPEDCPFVWDYMRQYVEETARIFDGVRLDNCHSTPLHVAEYLLDCARRIRPDLYVVAELFTNSDMTDNIFVNRLGITSLVREAMSAWDSHEEGRLVYRYGGYPVGSFYQPSVRPLVPSIAHALFLDLTHDNPSPVEKRSVFDLLPSTALVNMACCASGSNRGYDELVPHHIHVVDEIREYTEWTDDDNLALGNLRYVTRRSGIISAKKAINDLHFTLGKEGYNQVYVDQMDADIVAVTRHRPDTHESYILVAFTAFGHPNEDAAYHQRGIKPLRVEGVLDEISLEAALRHVNAKTGGSKFTKWDNFLKDSKWIHGLSEYQVSLKQHIQVAESDVFEQVDSGSPNVTQLNFKNFKPGSIVVVKVSLPKAMRDAVDVVRGLLNEFSITKETELSKIVGKLNLADLNRALYRCDQEERDEGFGFDTYHIPSFGSLVYAGLQGFMSLLANIRPNNDLGHPMCANLRDGNWMIEYIWKRLQLDEGTKELGQWIENNTKCFNNIPRYLVPSYFDVLVTGLYVLLIEQSYKLMSNFVNHGSTFVRGLSLGSLQFAAYIKSADLPTLSPNLVPPKPPSRKNANGEEVQSCVTLSAGLPHFAIGYMRNWGRDTFISLRGLFILTGRYEEARQHILGYAACLRHGLIPNLLDGGRNPRFNCRDAVWWWLYCIKEYADEAPNGLDILSDKVSRIFPTDDSPAQPPGIADQVLQDVMQEALMVHFQGLTFRERNAGRQIDEHMTDWGFNNQIGIHPETGFVFGGNEWNCGTWMDKMGSSDKAGNRGKPATPRDGSAVELIGLSKAVITWLHKLAQNNKYRYSGVTRSHKNGTVTKWSFKEWGDKIQANFEKYFWVNTTPVPDEYRPDLINKRGIYKDCYGATQAWSDFQLRPNFPIAMVAAPELFTPKQAWVALNQAEKYLLGPLGMKTLDPEDWAYRGDYDNSNDSGDPRISHGFNYHQGPEWVWPVGFFLRAKLYFAALNGVLPETLASTKLVLSRHFTELQTSPWKGLPELTNSNGAYCRDSSRTQAWSMACILEVLNDLQKIESKQPIVVN